MCTFIFSHRAEKKLAHLFLEFRNCGGNCCNPLHPRLPFVQRPTAERCLTAGTQLLTPPAAERIYGKNSGTDSLLNHAIWSNLGPIKIRKAEVFSRLSLFCGCPLEWGKKAHHWNRIVLLRTILFRFEAIQREIRLIMHWYSLFKFPFKRIIFVLMKLEAKSLTNSYDGGLGANNS